MSTSLSIEVRPLATSESGTERESTRHRLRLGSLLEAARSNPPNGMKVRSDAALAESLDRILSAHDSSADVHVFGYGSLMWNPALEHDAVVKARVHGWHRRFCLRQYLGRGAPGAPGVALALDRGGACRGLAYRIRAVKVREELQLLWRREMAFGGYEARWMTAASDGGPLRVLTFVANRASERYLGAAELDEIVHLIRTGTGILGSSRDYFEHALRALHTLGVTDAGMERLRLAIGRADQA
jgi:glutathione-specific gamma-glutamylcyclotransferase